MDGCVNCYYVTACRRRWDCLEAPMIMATLRMHTGDEPGIIKSFRMISAHARVQSGNIRCEILREVEMPGYVVYVEYWRDWETLKLHLRSNTYGQVLRLLELSTEEPFVEYRELSEPQGLKFLEAVRL